MSSIFLNATQLIKLFFIPKKAPLIPFFFLLLKPALLLYHIKTPDQGKQLDTHL